QRSPGILERANGRASRPWPWLRVRSLVILVHSPHSHAPVSDRLSTAGPMARAIVSAIPMDRLLAMAAARSLPSRCPGAALVAAISGFSSLTSRLVDVLGARAGAEALAGYVDPVFEALVADVHAYAGGVVGFAGDAITAWFDDRPLGADNGQPPAA